MKSPAFSVLSQLSALVAVVFLLSAQPVAAKPKGKEKGERAEQATQPRMHETLDALHEARRSPDPIPSMQTALERLHVAIHDKAGYRVEAAELVRQAIADVQANKRHDADQLIDEAITKVEKGIAAGN